MFSSEATGKCPKFRFLETGRQVGTFELYKYKETCTGSDSKDRVLEHEVHKPQYMTKVFHFMQKKLGITAMYLAFALEALKTNVFIW